MGYPNMANRKERGSSLLEFALVGVPAMFLCISVFAISMTMWQYHTLAFVAQRVARYVTAHGYNCGQDGNSCSITLANVATYAEASAIGLDKSKLNLKLTASSGDTSCAPVTNCDSNGGTYPVGSTDGAVGADIVVTATYSVNNPITMFWPGAGTVTTPSNLTLKGESRQRITF
jgi:Flp pilus assembly protein TadG